MVDEAYGDCLRILQDNRESLDRLASELIKKEVIYREELIRIIGKKSPGEKVKEKGAL
jgi:cell division protease FtsH